MISTDLPNATVAWQNLTNAISTFLKVEGSSPNTLRTTEDAV
jgi:hypothetical protein